MELKKIAVYNEVLFTQIITFMTFPNDETGQILAEMQDAGIDLSIIHPVVFFQLFEKKEQAQAMADYLAEHAPEMELVIHPDETPNVWDLDCTVKMLPCYDAIVAQEAQLEQLAAKYNGYNDGWGMEA
ncbi:MAG: regulator of RNase E activity RraB [Colwellia sp.]